MKKKVELNKTERIQKLLKAGHPPDTIAYDVGCSKQYVYNVRAKMSGIDGQRKQAKLPARKRVVPNVEIVIPAKPKKEVIHCITNVGNLVTVTIVRNPTPEQRNSFLDELKKAL